MDHQDDRAIGVIGILIVLVLIVGGIVVSVPVGYYLGDGAVEAVVVDKKCGSNPLGETSKVTVETRFPVPGVQHVVKEFPNDKCNLVNKDNYVEHRLRSGRTTLYQSEGGSCIYDSEKGIGC
ncbi:MAG: hypothetical protein ACPGQL_06675 [Thermoplasmatota archaeon]